MARPPLPVGGHGHVSRKQIKPNLWEARVRFRDATGTVHEAKVWAESGAKAERLVLARIKEKTAFTDGAINPDMLVSKLAELWLAERVETGSVKPQTVYRNRGVVRNHLNPTLGGLRIRELTRSRINGAIAKLRKGAPSQARHVVSILKGMMDLAADHEAITFNPTAGLTGPAKKSKEIVVLTLDQVNALRLALSRWQDHLDPNTGEPIKHVGRPRPNDLLDIVDLMLGTGARIGEALAIRWQDIDLGVSAPTVTIRGTVVYIPGEGFPRQDQPKTQSGNRVLALPGFAVAMLLNRKVQAGVSEQDVVFPSASGTIRSTNNFHRQWRAASEQIGFGWVTPHSFRRTVATRLDAEGDLEAAAKQLGHANTAITDKHYVKREATVIDNTAILEAFGAPTDGPAEPQRGQ